jgi:hypothetical protein
MAIQGIKPDTFDQIRGGRVTARNLTNMIHEFALVASNISFLGDAQARKRDGYTLNRTLSSSIQFLFDFPRQSDLTQFLVANYGTNLAFMPNDGSGSPTVLSSGESSTHPFSFATSSFGLYMSNGLKSYAEYNKGSGQEHLYNPIQAPATAPTVALAGGTLSLTYGRQYAYCYVRKWTDSLGTQRYHIGPPSALSADTGPFINSVVNVGGLIASVDTDITHIWIFSTTDVAAGQGSSFIFCGEVTNGTTTFGDTQTVLQLDSSRVMPIDNLPWVPCKKLVEYQGRIALVGIVSDPASVFFTGLGEVDLGIPQETIPAEVRFTVPGKNKQISGAAQFNQSFWVCTPAMWFQVQGYDQNTFQKTDDVMEPGACGFEAIAQVQGQLMWMGPDKKIWGFDGSSAPIDLSQKLQTPLPGSLSMNDISDAQLPNVVLRVLNFGKKHLLLVGVSTDGSAGINWIQAWDASNAIASTGYSQYLTDGTTVGLAESDYFLTHRLTTMNEVTVVNTKYMFFGDSSGHIFRFPDGGTDAGSTATVTATAVASNVLTVTCSNSFTNGQKVSLNGLTVHTELNRQVLTIASASGSQFTAAWTHANYSTKADTGKAVSNPIQATWGSVYSDNQMPGVIKKQLFADIYTDRTDALKVFGIRAVAQDGTNMTTTPTTVPTQAKYAGYGIDTTIVQGLMLQQLGTAMGIYARVLVDFPNDDLDAGLQKLELTNIPLAQTQP